MPRLPGPPALEKGRGLKDALVRQFSQPSIKAKMNVSFFRQAYVGWAQVGLGNRPAPQKYCPRGRRGTGWREVGMQDWCGAAAV